MKVNPPPMGFREEWDAKRQAPRRQHMRASAADTFRRYVDGEITKAQCLAILRLIDERRAMDARPEKEAP
jgi:hypothetical protein